jgi:hypothetical protein
MDLPGRRGSVNLAGVAFSLTFGVQPEVTPQVRKTRLSVAEEKDELLHSSVRCRTAVTGAGLGGAQFHVAGQNAPELLEPIEAVAV